MEKDLDAYTFAENSNLQVLEEQYEHESDFDQLAKLERMREQMKREHEAWTKLFERLEKLRKSKSEINND